jgi:hypothetical protein
MDEEPSFWEKFRFVFGHAYVENSILEQVNTRYPEYEATAKELQFGNDSISNRVESSLFGAGFGLVAGAGGMLFLLKNKKGKLWTFMKGIGFITFPFAGLLAGSSVGLSSSMVAWSVMDKEPTLQPLSFMAEFVRESSMEAIGKPPIYPCLSKEELDKEYQKLIMIQNKNKT